MYQNILVAIDGSHTSEIALNEAIKLAGEQHGRLRIVNVVEMVYLNQEGVYIDPREIWDAMRKSGQAILDKALAVARATGIEAETKLLEIDGLGLRIPEVIADEAATWPADLIVVGTHGRRGMSHLFLGSIAEGVARVASKPLLLIRGE